MNDFCTFSKPPGTTAPTPTSTGGGGGGGDRVDYEALTDVMGYAGVDLKEEAEHFMKEDASGTVLPDGIDRSKFQDFMNPAMLRDRILKYGMCIYGISFDLRGRLLFSL